jgi:hypothetical protein
VCGIVNGLKRRKVTKLANYHSINLMGIQESFMSSLDVCLVRILVLWGNTKFEYEYVSARGHYEGLISNWGPLCFQKSSSVCTDNAIICKAPFPGVFTCWFSDTIFIILKQYLH